MEYYEHEAITLLAGLGLKFFRTGSREICRPAPTDTDADFVVLGMGRRGGDLTNFGFTHTNLDTSNDYQDTDIETYRRGEVNLIVVFDKTEFWKWKVATAAAKQMNIKEKRRRIALFQGVLYGNW